MSVSWQQLQIKANPSNAEWISDCLLEFGASSVTLLDAKNQPLLEPPPGATPLWDEAWVVGLFAENIDLSTIIAQFKLMLGDKIIYQLQGLIDKDWDREWMQHFQPLQFGEHLWITPKAMQTAINDPDAIKVILDPGLAFGTGTHPTTALCLQWLATHIKAGMSVLDFGCGSGILAIAAVKLGAVHAVAIDNDPQAITATQRNSQTNQISTEQLIACLPEHCPPQQFDIVIANILANPLIALAPMLSAKVKPQGNIVLSGILLEQAEAIIEAYRPWFKLSSQSKNEWVLLSGKKQ